MFWQEMGMDCPWANVEDLREGGGGLLEWAVCREVLEGGGGGVGRVRSFELLLWKASLSKVAEATLPFVWPLIVFTSGGVA